jgi:RIO kinase 1
VLFRVKSGKEATVYCCEGPCSGGRRLVAAKVFKPLHERSFRDDSVYQRGRHIKDARLARAYRNKSRAGRSVQFGLWVEHEWEVLKELHAAGADVPEPYEIAGDTIYMEWIGDREEPAPLLHGLRLSPPEARQAFAQVVENVVGFLRCDVVHADLSAFNILWWEGRVRVIDFPQAVRPAENPDAPALLERDLRALYSYFAPYGIAWSPEVLAADLWRAYLRNALQAPPMG